MDDGGVPFFRMSTVLGRAASGGVAYMTLEITQNGQVYENNTTVTGAPGVRISGTNVRFINQVNGQVDSTLAGSPAISIEAAGAVIVNDVGGVINAFSASDVAIMGSANADSVDNAGSVVGRVELGGGADIYTVRGGVNVGDTVNGGAGVDRVVLTGDIGNANGGAMTGFEQLQIGPRVLNVTGFSGYQTVTLDALGFVTFLDSNNPLADLILSGGVAIVGNGSVFQDVTGTAGRDDFEVNSGTITGSVDLAGGNDIFGFTWVASAGEAPTVGGTISGGAGGDQANIVVDNGATIDMSQLVSFEAINTGTFTSVVGNVRLVNANNYSFIAVDGGGGVLTLANSNSGNAQVTVLGQGSLVLEATATIGSVIAASDQGGADQSFSVTNNGTILGGVALSAGNDVYAGAGGFVVGTIFGGAGNDIISTGVGDHRIEGGAGTDTLDGGFGNDMLFGDDGDDILIGGKGRDTLDGGAGNDTLNLEGSLDDYFVVREGDAWRVTSARDSDLVLNVETVSLSGTAVSWATFTAEAFDGLRYIASNSDLRVILGADAEAGEAHYRSSGEQEGRSLTAFDPLRYAASYPDLINALGANPAALSAHYIRYGADEGRSVTFDPLKYVLANADLFYVLGIDELALTEHYVRFGFFEGRAIADFDPLSYGASYPDLINVYGTDEQGLAQHYIQYGRSEGRAATFDPLLYGATYSDLIVAFGPDTDAFARHYITAGFYEGRIPDGFDPVAYLLSYADLANSGGGVRGALEHWVESGYNEARDGDGLFGREQASHEAAVGGEFDGILDPAGDRDWFSLSLDAGEDVSIGLSGAGAGAGSLQDAFLRVYDSLGQPIAFDDNSGQGNDAALDFVAGSAGIYYVVVGSAGDTGAGSYTLTIDPIIG